MRQVVYTISTYKEYGCFAADSTDILGERALTKLLDYSDESMTQLHEEDDYLVLKNPNTSLGYQQYLVHTKTYSFDNSDQVIQELFYALVASGDDYIQLLQKSISWNEAEGYIASEKIYTIKENDDGTWANPQMSEEGVNVGNKYKKDFEVFKDPEDGHWYSTVKYYVDYRTPEGKIKNSESEYIPKKDDDGTWRGLETHTIGYAPNGNKRSESYFEIKKDEKYGSWVSLIKDDYSWYDEGGKSYEDHYSVLQNDDGTWSSVLVSEKVWFRTGGISKEVSNTPVKGDNGFWTAKEVSCTSYNRDGSAHECPHY